MIEILTVMVANLRLTPHRPGSSSVSTLVQSSLGPWKYLFVYKNMSYEFQCRLRLKQIVMM